MKPLVWHQHRGYGDHTMPTIEAFPYVITIRPKGKLRFVLRRCQSGKHSGLMELLGTFQRAAEAKAAAVEHRKTNT